MAYLIYISISVQELATPLLEPVFVAAKIDGAGEYSGLHTVYGTADKFAKMDDVRWGCGCYT